MLAGRLILPGNGLTAGNEYPPLSLADEATLRAAIGSVLYLAPFAAMLVSDPQWHERLPRFAQRAQLVPPRFKTTTRSLP